MLHVRYKAALTPHVHHSNQVPLNWAGAQQRVFQAHPGLSTGTLCVWGLCLCWCDFGF